MMERFGQPIFVAPGLRTPFGRGGGALSTYNTLSISVPVVRMMAAQAEPDILLWGNVIPNPSWSNLAREIWLHSRLNPSVPALTVVLACATSIAAVFAASGMLGGGINLAMVGGSEVMSRPSISLTPEASRRLTDLFAQDAERALVELQKLPPQDFLLPIKGWVNWITGRSMGDHMEETAKAWGISRQAQDDWALLSHQRAVAGWEAGFFNDLVLPLAELARDANPRSDTSAAALAALKPAFDHFSGEGSLTAGNSSPITDGAAGCWVANEAGLARLPPGTPFARLIDFELSAVDIHSEGLLMAPSYGIPRLLARHGLQYSDIALWEIHEAFAAQVLANVAAITDPKWVRNKTGVETDLGAFDWSRVNPNGGSVAIGHPFGATGARDLSQAIKELWELPSGSRAIVSICADGGQGSVTLIERV